MIQSLRLEPYCWSTREIGELTDHQFWEQIIKPAIARNRRQRNRPRNPSPTDNRMPTKEEYVAGGVALGGRKEDMEATYDKWLASKENNNATPETDTRSDC